MKKHLNAILVGCGTMGKRHMSRFSAYGVFFSKIIDSLDDVFLNGEKPDFVVIASPATSHYKYVKLCLNRKIPVFVEKPLAITEVQVLELLNLSKETRTLLFVAQSECFNPIFLNFRSHFVRELKLTSMQQTLDVNLEFRREHKFSERCRDVNVALDLLVHDISLFLMMFSYDSIFKKNGKLLKNGDEATLVLDAIENNVRIHANFYVNRNSNINIRQLSATFPGVEYVVSLDAKKEKGEIEHLSDSLENEHKFFLKLLAGACEEWGNRLLETSASAVFLACKCHEYLGE